MYSAYELTEESRAKLLQEHTPSFSKVICHHITYQFPVSSKDDLPPTPKTVKIIGYNVSRTIGVECFVVEIDGEKKREDGSFYHITISVDEAKGARPVQSNELLRKHSFNRMFNPITIEVIPKVLS